MKTMLNKLFCRDIFKLSSFTAIAMLFIICIQAYGKEVVQGSKSVAVSKVSNTQEKKKSLPKLLDLGAKKCVPCKMMAPILDEMEKTYKGVLDVEFVDVWMAKNRKIATKYKIRSIPTQIFLDANGKEIWRHVGFISKSNMLKKWKELGYDFKPVIKKASTKSTK